MAHPSPHDPKARLDRELDAALADSFPASDPPAPVRDPHPQMEVEETAKADACAQKIHDSRTLDEALDETFPASDPPAVTQPHPHLPAEGDDGECEIP